jgi:hypothetical protein
MSGGRPWSDFIIQPPMMTSTMLVISMRFCTHPRRSSILRRWSKDPDLTLNEKRAILASWASDACAIETVPTLRCLPGGKRPVHFDEVMDALRALDEEARRTRRAADNHRVLDRSRKRSSNSSSDEGRGHSLS